MKKTASLLLVACLAVLTACKKPIFFPPAVVSVQLTSSKGNTIQSDTVSDSYSGQHLSILMRIDSTAYPAADSINLILHSSLISNGPAQNHVEVDIDVDHVFARSAVTRSDQYWDFYNLNDVISIFRGPVTPMRRGILHSNTINISIMPPGSNDIYSLADAPDGAMSALVVTYVGEEYDIFKVLNNTFIPRSSSTFRPQLIKINYSGLLVCTATADTMTVQNLTYQGFIGNSRY